MSFAETGVVCFAVLAFLGPILVFVSAVLIRRRLQHERQKSDIYRVQGLDPPLGTRDPALLWPSVLAKPPESATAISLASARSSSPLDDDDSHIAKRPCSFAASNSSCQSMQQTTASNDFATPRTMACGTFEELHQPATAVIASSPMHHSATGHIPKLDKNSKSGSDGDCQVQPSDVGCSRDQYSLPANTGALAGPAHFSARPQARISTTQVPFVQHVLQAQRGNRLQGHWNASAGDSLGYKVSEQSMTRTQPVQVTDMLPADASLHLEESSRLHPLCA